MNRMQAFWVVVVGLAVVSIAVQRSEAVSYDITVFSTDSSAAEAISDNGIIAGKLGKVAVNKSESTGGPLRDRSQAAR